ncbi:hypothetical protein HX004_09650 [Myroides sp. 1354]|uniref:hypothetical protein n=1 Tax=unclassified Myroides TaxID=2642485 RepID=UPI002574F576|nr:MULTISPECIES: hypothetical protein [unclassified Myroides]MDM1045158.1 hypothetical protein [Myroides sp. R163-1]MDM1056040.1 hypothetical protein [Myroides sp. 1354]MDM1069011.1 hypothetical protein [Myroides sp. 1372]
MKKLLLGLALTLSLGTFANSGEIIKDDQIIHLIKTCYRFDVDRTKWVNHNPTSYTTSYTEYGMYTEAGAYQRSLELSQLYPTDIDQNGNGYLSLHAYSVSNISNCTGLIPAISSDN